MPFFSKKSMYVARTRSALHVGITIVITEPSAISLAGTYVPFFDKYYEKNE